MAINRITGTALGETISFIPDNIYSQAYIVGMGGGDYLFGASGADTLDGGDGADYLVGDAGADSLVGGAADDSLYGGAGADTLRGEIGNDYLVADYNDLSTHLLFGDQGNDTLSGSAGADVLSGGADQDFLYGEGGNDKLLGEDGNDYIQGGAGADTLYGGAGNDSLYSSGYGVADAPNVLYGDAGDDYLNGSDVSDRLDGGADNDSLWGGDGADTLIGGDGNDTLSGGGGLDFHYGGNGNDYLSGTNYLSGDAGDDSLYGSDAADTLYGGTGNDSLFGGDGADVLNGGTGNDTLAGGIGNDIYYVDSLGDVIQEWMASDGDIDTAYVSVDGYLPTSYIENVVYTNGTKEVPYFIRALYSGYEWNPGSAAPITLTYSFRTTASTDNSSSGFRSFSSTEQTYAKEMLSVIAAQTNIVFKQVADSDSSNIRFGADEQSVSAGYAYYPYSSSSSVYIDNDLDGRYWKGVLLHEIGHALGLKHPGNYNAGGGGTEGPYLPSGEDDTANSVMSYNGEYGRTSLGMFDIASLQLLYGVNGNINSGDTTFLFANRYISDAVGIDSLDASNSTLMARIDLAPGRWSWLGSKQDSILAANQLFIGYNSWLENAAGGAGNDIISGNALSNKLTGNNGNDSLNGSSGIDSMYGGLGNDTYYVDHASDYIAESSDSLNGGIDTVISSVTRTLGNYQENLTLSGSAAINGTGNTHANKLVGNSAANALNGGSGIDSMYGGLGNDTYYVDHASDYIVESSDSTNGGFDTVISSVSYTLGNYQEKLDLSGPTAIIGNGNALANILIGSIAGNVLNGGSGIDSMYGGLGNDTYYVDHASDYIAESSDSLNGGIDTVISSVTRTLGNYQEKLTLSGATAINGTGNTLANTLMGNTGNNILNGAAGNDVLIGGAGKDGLTGGTGADRFDFNALSEILTGTSRDVISDFKAAEGDKLDLSTLDANTTTTATNEAFSYIGGNAFTQAGQLRLVNGILYGNTDADSTAEFEIQLTGVSSLTSLAFVL